MKLDEQYRKGENRPYSEFRQLLWYVKERQFKCIHCGESTHWVLIATMAAVCSDDCVYAQVREVNGLRNCSSESLQGAVSANGTAG